MMYDIIINREVYMNKKGFTTIELILSFIMVVVILTSLIGFTTAYRGRVNREQTKSALIDFKNTVTKAVYDDIISHNVVSMTNCVGEDNCVNLIGQDGSIHTLKVEVIANSSDKKNDGVYLKYNDIKYKLPDSELNKTYVDADLNVQVTDSACNITDFIYSNYNNRIFNVKIPYKHYLIDDKFEISITIS